MTTPPKPTDIQPVSSPLPAQPAPDPSEGADVTGQVDKALAPSGVALASDGPASGSVPASGSFSMAGVSEVPTQLGAQAGATTSRASSRPLAEELQADAEEEERGPQTIVPREAEEAQNALQEVESLLKHHAAVQESAWHEVERGSEHGEVPSHLLEEQYLSHLRARLENLHPADIAYVLEALPQDDRAIVWDSVKRGADGAILLEVSEPVLESLVDAMTEDELVAAVKDLDADDVADLAEHLPPAVVERVRHALTPEEQQQLQAVMSYPEDSVGAWMDFEFVRVREDVTLEVVLRYLRRFDELPQHTDQVFVVDRDGILIGSLSIEQLLTNEPDTDVSAVMHREILSLEATDDVGDAAQAFERYDLVSAPVVDEAGTLIGRLTVNDVVDVIREEGETDVLNQAGLREDEDLFASVWQSASNRWLWLAVNLVTAFVASRVIGLFDDTIEKVVALAALMPIVAGLAGNSGNQTMALVIRSLALGQVTGSNFGRLLRKELTVALLNGVVWGTVAGGVSWLLYHDSEYAMLLGVAMAIAIVLNLLIGALLGVIVPFTLEKFGRDPAIGSSVLLTFSTDGLGFLIFLGLATILF